VLIKLVTIGLLILWNTAFAQMPVSTDTYKEIQNKFLENETLSFSKIEKYKEYLKKLQTEVETNIENYEMDQGKLSPEKAEQLADKNKYVKSIKMLRKQWVDRAISINDRTELVEYLSKIIDLENAIRVEITPTFSERLVIDALHTFMYNYKILIKKTSTFGEANNLINPQTGKYFSSTELEKLKEQKVDISKFDPPKENGVIELIDDIAIVDPAERYRKGNNPLHEGLGVVYPEENVGFFKELKKSQTHPKIVFETKDSEGNVLHEYKLKMGVEIHSEPTAASLGMTLGLYQDLSKHVKNFKIYIGEMSWDEFVLDFSSYYKYEDLERIVASHGRDRDFGNYIIFNEGVLEAKFEKDDLLRVGPFYPSYKKGKRELRALMLFNMWIGNADLKAGDNNKLIIRKKGNLDQLYYVQHDVGFGFGYYNTEKPSEFPWTLIRGKINGEIVFNFRSFVPNDGWGHVTFADAKWMSRKIAQLTRKQITECVKFGKWPDKAPYNYEQLIIEKLIARRNQLVKTFELAGEVLPNGKTIKFLAVDRTITKDAKPTDNFLEGQTADFRSSIKYNYVKPALRTLRGTIVDGLAGITKRIDKISIPNTWLGLDQGGVIAMALVGTDKQVIKNPDPTGVHDRYIVREAFRVGARLGYGAMFRADTSYVKEYTLVYPISDLSKMDKDGTWIVDVTIPYRIMKNFLPPKHILITESYVEGAVRTRIQTPLTGGGNETSLSRVNLSRTIISKKEDGVVKVFEDTSKFSEIASKLFIKLAIFRLDQFEAKFSQGKLNRDIYVLKLDNDSSEAIDKAVMNNNSEDIKKYAIKTHEIDSKFIENSSQLNIFGFFQKERNSRTDEFEVITFNEAGEIEKLEHQLEGTYVKRDAWKIITNGEERIARVTMSSKYDSDDNLIEPYLFLNFEHIDLNTTANELDNAYIPFFNGIANDDKFIQFSANEHSLTGKYGHLNLHLREKIYKEGLIKLLNLKAETFWNELSSLLGIENILKLSNKFVNYQGKQYNLKRIRRKATNVLNLIMLSQKRESMRFKIKSLMKAIVESIPRKRNSQNPIILATLNKIMGQENFYLNAEIESPSYQENKMPGSITPYNFQGDERPGVDRDLMQLQLGDALKIYNLF